MIAGGRRRSCGQEGCADKFVQLKPSWTTTTPAAGSAGSSSTAGPSRSTMSAGIPREQPAGSSSRSGASRQSRHHGLPCWQYISCPREPGPATRAPRRLSSTPVRGRRCRRIGKKVRLCPALVALFAAVAWFFAAVATGPLISWAAQSSREVEAAEAHVNWVRCWLTQRQRWLDTSRRGSRRSKVSLSSTRAAGHRGLDFALPSNSGTEPMQFQALYVDIDEAQARN